MNWYKKYIFSQSGEYWLIDGQATFADGTIGDLNHSGIVIEHIFSIHDMDEMTDISNITPEQRNELTQEEKDVIDDKMDPREYGMKKLGWQRVSKNNIQTENLTQEDLSNIVNGLFEAYDGEIEDNTNISFNIEVNSNNAFYRDIPWDILQKESLEELLPYRTKF